MIKVLFFGDVVGRIGRDSLFKKLPMLKQLYSPDLLIINGENSANGKGITNRIYDAYKKNGIDCITSGNHIFDNKDIVDSIDSLSDMIRPINYPRATPGNKIFVKKINGVKVAVINILGQVFMPPIDNPFQCMDDLLCSELQDIPVIIVDIHAEATSEKKAFGCHFAGRVSAVLGTHTHVPTADRQIINNYTGFISDVGMVGAADSILGMAKENVITKFLTQVPVKFAPPETDLQVQMDYVYMEINEDGSTEKIEAFHDFIPVA